MRLRIPALLWLLLAAATAAAQGTDAGRFDARRSAALALVAEGEDADGGIRALEALSAEGDTASTNALGGLLSQYGRCDAAVKLLTAPATAGNPESQFQLSLAYFCKRDAASADITRTWLQRAANNGSSKAIAQCADAASVQRVGKPSVEASACVPPR